MGKLLLLLFTNNIFIHKRQNTQTGIKKSLRKHLKKNSFETWYSFYSHVLYVHSKTVMTYFIGFVIFTPPKNFSFLMYYSIILGNFHGYLFSTTRVLLSKHILKLNHSGSVGGWPRP